MRYLTNPIIDAAFDSILAHLRPALVLTLVAVLLSALVLALTWGPLIWSLQGVEGRTPASPGQVPLALLGLVAVVYMWFWVAVRWHRLSLGVDGGGLGRPLVYGLVSFGITLLIFVPLMFLMLFAALASGQGNVAFRIGEFGTALSLWQNALNLAATFLASYIFLRFAPWLVGAALGVKGPPAFARTRALRGEIAHVAGIYAIALLLYGTVGALSLPGPLQIVVDLAFAWIAFMMSIAVLTEIYRLTEPAAGAAG